MPIPVTSPGHLLALLAWPSQVTGGVALDAISEAPGNAVRGRSAIQHLRKEGRLLGFQIFGRTRQQCWDVSPCREGLVRGKVSRKSQQVAKAREEEWLTLEYPPGREEELAGGINASRQITLEIREARLKTRQPENEGLAHSQPGHQGAL